MAEGESPDDGQAGQWSPFPVQDWSTMPEAVGTSDAPDLPDQRPRKRQRSGVLAMITVTLCVVLVGAGIGLSDRVGATTRARGVLAFVPVDGAVRTSAVHLSGTPGSTFTEVTESARFAGAEGIGGLDFSLGSQVLATADDIEKAPLWRTTSTRVGGGRTDHQTVRIYRVSDGISLVAESGPDAGYVYRPALIEVPAGAVVGSRWTGQGTAGARMTYRSDLRAEAAGPGCLDVRGSIVYQSSEGRRLPTRTVRKTWCEAQGIVSSSDAVPTVTRTEEALSGVVDHGDLTTVDKVRTWEGSTVWATKPQQVITDDPQFGVGQMTSAAAGRAPGFTASGLLVRATVSSGDVVAFGPQSEGRWVALWRMHPGGTVLQVSIFGDVIVVTTSARKVVAYSDRGVRLWQQELDDVVLTSPQRLSAREVLVAAVDGEVIAVNLINGRRLWRTSMRGDVTIAPAVGEGSLAVARRDGRIAVLDAGDGKEVASLEVSRPEAVAVINSTLVVRTEGYLEGFELATGERRWRVVFSSIVDQMMSLGDWLVVAGREQTVALDLDGRIRWRQHGFTDVVTDGSTLIALNGDRAEHIDSAGSILSGFSIPTNTVAVTIHPVASPHGVWLFGQGWGFTEYVRER